MRHERELEVRCGSICYHVSIHELFNISSMHASYACFLCVLSQPFASCGSHRDGPECKAGPAEDPRHQVPQGRGAAVDS